MHPMTRDDLLSLEKYASERATFRDRVMQHKRKRRIDLGDHVTLHFEDRLTMQYQIQEMLRAEKIFDPDEIQAELDAYNPLIPDGSNLKATLLIQYPDVEERRAALQRLIGVEDRVWLRVAGCDPVYPIADEDLERDSDEKTSSVHFLRFEFTPEMVAAAKEGAALSAGVDHAEYRVEETAIDAAVRESLVNDFD